MSSSLSAAAYLEKNALSNTGVWLILLQITIPNLSTIYIVLNNENITWPSTDGNEYIAFPFELDEISESSKGETPQLVIRVSNISRAMSAYLENGNGGIDSTVILRVVHSAHLDLTDPEVEMLYTVLKADSDERWVSFTLGAANPYNKIFPGHRVLRLTCRYRQFKGTHCGYTGEETTCDRSYSRCVELGNASRFGNAIGVGARGVYV